MKLRIKRHWMWSPYDIIGCVLVFVQLLSAVFPMFILVGNNAIICLAAYVLWLCIAFMQSKHTLMKIISKLWYTIPFMVYVAFVPYLFGNGSIGNRYVNLLGFVFGIWTFMYYQERQRLKVIKNAIIMALPFFIITLYTTMMAGLGDAYIIRQVDYKETSFMYLSRNIAGYHFIYVITILGVVLFSMGLTTTSKWRFFYILTSFVCVALIIVSNFFTAVAVCIVGFGVMLVCYLRQKRTVGFFITILVVPLILVGGSLLIDTFVELFDKGGRIYKVIGGEDSIINAFVKEFLDDRAPTIVLSIEAFLEHPIFGLVFEKLANNGTYDTGYGQHSYIFDTLALYGVGIGVLATIILFLPLTKLDAIKKNKIYAIPLFVMIGLIAIFNNVTNYMASITTMVVPYLVYTATENKKIQS